MSKTFLLGFALGVFALVTGVVAAPRPTIKQTHTDARHQANLSDATPIRPGVITVQQRIHSKFFQRFSTDGEANQIYKAMLASPGQDVGITRIASSELQPEIDNPTTLFQTIAGESDAVIRGHVISKASQATENMGFVFTDYSIEVSEILKNNRVSRLSEGDVVTITRPGGKISIGDVVVTVSISSFLPLQLNSEVVLFVQFIPKTGTYATLDSTGSFEINGPFTKALTQDDLRIPLESIRESDDLLAYARVAVKN